MATVDGHTQTSNVEVAGDMSGNAFLCAQWSSDQVQLQATQGLAIAGVFPKEVNRADAAGKIVALQTGGVGKVMVDAAFSSGQLLTPAVTTGKGEAAVTGDIVFGEMLEASTADGDIVRFKFTSMISA